LYYQNELEKTLFEFLWLAGPSRGAFASLYRLPGETAAASTPGKAGLVVVAADKGLCGDFNNGILREGDSYLKKNRERVGALVAIGRKSAEHYRKVTVAQKREHAQFFNKFDYALADKIGQEVYDIYIKEKLSELVVVHSHFKSRIKHELTVTRLLPIEPVMPKDNQYRSMMIEPAEEEAVLAALLPMYVKAKLYGIMRDSYAAELAARMSAMDNATRNAGDLIDSITLEMNKVRQAVITREIAEIISTNEVVK
jgi:F-type H+-transporting ATPase subunit gamma